MIFKTIANDLERLLVVVKKMCDKTKKLFKLVFIVMLIVAGYYLKQVDTAQISTYCAFCDFKNRVDRQETYVYEDDLVQAFPSVSPIHPGHMLVIPKRHVRQFEDLSEVEVNRIMAVLKKIHQAFSILLPEPPAYFMWQKNGREAFQTVPHVHFHYIPRPKGSFSNVMFFGVHVLIGGLIRGWLTPEALRKEAERVRTAMSGQKTLVSAAI